MRTLLTRSLVSTNLESFFPQAFHKFSVNMQDKQKKKPQQKRIFIFVFETWKKSQQKSVFDDLKPKSDLNHPAHN